MSKTFKKFNLNGNFAYGEIEMEDVLLSKRKTSVKICLIDKTKTKDSSTKTIWLSDSKMHEDLQKCKTKLGKCEYDGCVNFFYIDLKM